MQIKAFKLTTGDEIVAKVLAEQDGSFVIQDALMMVVQMAPKSKEHPEGGMFCQFYPWTIINEGSINLQAIGVLAHYNVPADVERSYTQNVSGLTIVSGAAASQILNG